MAALLTKPVQPSELLDAVLTALSPATTLEMPQQPLALGPQGEGKGMKVLLAEDNAVNRTLAKKLLEKHGHTVVLAENGREALDALYRETVDLVLMDLQMPVMDGLEAIAAVRKKEVGTGVHLPIVALTAHAMKGDRERCLAAGADDYLIKPIHTPALLATLDRIRTAKITEGSTTATAATTATNVTTSSMDMADALQRVEGDSDLLEEIARIFVDECARIMAEIRDALDTPDAHLLEQSAHRLKGSSSNLGAKSLAQSASELELMARAGDLRSARLHFNTIEAEVSKLFLELETISRKVAR
jgi:two-component system, sensor histidine kinase and response regulator